MLLNSVGGKESFLVLPAFKMLISKEMLFGVILSVTIWTSSAAEYVPGEPGGPWTQEELLIVKAKVWSLLPRGVAYRSYQKVSLIHIHQTVFIINCFNTDSGCQQDEKCG